MSRFNIVLPAVAPGLKPSYNSEVCPSGPAIFSLVKPDAFSAS